MFYIDLIKSSFLLISAVHIFEAIWFPVVAATEQKQSFDYIEI